MQKEQHITDQRLAHAENLSNNDFPHIFELAHHLGRDILIFDTETTGLSEKTSEILEFAFLLFQKDDNELLYNGMLIKNNHPIPDKTTKIHGLHQEIMDKEGILFTDFYPMVNDFFKTSVISGFNSRQYDMRMMKSCCKRYGIDFVESDQIDVRDVYIKHNNGSTSGRLIDACKEFGLPILDAHEAMSDTIMSAYALNHLTNLYGVEFVVDCYRCGDNTDTQPNLFC